MNGSESGRSLRRGSAMTSCAGPSTLVGECKSYASICFQPKDVNRLRDLATLLPGAYLVAATLKNELSVDEKTRLAKLAAWGWQQPRPSPLIVLTGHELFGNGPVSAIWKEAGGKMAEIAERHSYIRNFIELAALTQEVHLDMAAEAINQARYGRRRARARSTRDRAK